VIPTDSGYGSKIVYAQFKDNADNVSSVYDDTIFYTLKGDFDSNKLVDINDVITLASWWLSSCGIDHCQAVDIDLDGNIDLEDFADITENWGITVE